MGADVPHDLKEAHRQLASRVMGRRGVTGTAIGRDRGRPCLKVYVSDPRAEPAVPETVGGYPVIVEKTGAFRRL
jgi:hypothetical protein